MNMYMAIVLSLHIEASDNFVKAREAWQTHKANRPSDPALLSAWLDEDMRLFEEVSSAAQALDWLRSVSPLSRMAGQAVEV